MTAAGVKIKPANLLIVRTDRIGDVVLSLPLASIIKKNFPGCRVTFLLREYTKSLAENHPFIDEVLILNESGGKISLLKNIRMLSEKKFDSCVIVYPTFLTALIVFLSGVKNRIGTGFRWYSLLFNNKVYEHRKFAERHELEYNVNLLQCFGIFEKPDYRNVEFNIQINSGSKAEVKSLLHTSGVNDDKPLIIVHPGSGGSSVDLPPEKFRELIGLISTKLDAEILVTGTEKEKVICSRLVVNERVKNFAGLLSLSELIALIDKCSIFVSNSTGPIHIAAALEKYTIGFYPNLLACSAKRWGPYTAKKIIFTPEKECMDCKMEQCSAVKCMNSIKVIDAFVQIEKIYKFIVPNGELNA